MMKLCLSFLLPVSLMACKCLISYPVCNAVAASDLVFIGIVESIEPAFLDPWNPARLSALPTAEIMRLRQEGTPPSLVQLKEIYSRLYPNLPEPFKTQIQTSQTHRELEAVVEAIGAQGIQTRIRVKKYFKRPEDDDEQDSDDIVTVWTSANDCGYNFQKGETYLVYAETDEETGRIETSVCTRTKRLTDAGPDLAYLYFRENAGDAATRLEGFVTDDGSEDLPRLPDSVHSPVPSAVLQLNSPDGSRYTRTGSDGRFVFDGLAEGKYELTAFGADYPTATTPLSPPTQFSADKNSCAREILIVPKSK